MKIKLKNFMKLHFKLFLISKIDFCPFLKSQIMDFGENNFFSEIVLFDFTTFLNFLADYDIEKLYQLTIYLALSHNARKGVNKSSRGEFFLWNIFLRKVKI